ncbi:MAG: hypothetical protein M5U19_20640 [Microthrixaceae bacterium]|nr:hypothetical protein [Microthrixaceae bacterium]
MSPTRSNPDPTPGTSTITMVDSATTGAAPSSAISSRARPAVWRTRRADDTAMQTTVTMATTSPPTRPARAAIAATHTPATATAAPTARADTSDATAATSMASSRTTATK